MHWPSQRCAADMIDCWRSCIIALAESPSTRRHLGIQLVEYKTHWTKYYVKHNIQQWQWMGDQNLWQFQMQFCKWTKKQESNAFQLRYSSILFVKPVHTVTCCIDTWNRRIDLSLGSFGSVSLSTYSWLIRSANVGHLLLMIVWHHLCCSLCSTFLEESLLRRLRKLLWKKKVIESLCVFLYTTAANSSMYEFQ